MSTGSLRFELSGAPVGADEQRAFASDLERLDLDECYWQAMNGLLSTKSRSDTPLVLRGYRGTSLAAIAHLLECRRTGHCLFPGKLGACLDVAPMPMYCWTRGDAAVDLLSSPGFVAPGEDRETFYREAIAFLNARYLSGSVVEPRDNRRAAPCYETAVMDWGRYTVEPDGVERLTAAHKHLRRKENRFRSKGGTLHIVTERLGPRERDAVLDCVRQSAGLALVRAPFQENYANMVRWAAESGAPGIVHILARIDDDIVGYHTFLRTGRRLQCLSGGFDRSRPSTFHAYENILLEAMRFAESEGLRHVAFGPTSNPSKAAVMPAFGRFVVRFYSRFALVRRMFASVVPRSALRPEVFESCTDLPGKMPAPGAHAPSADVRTLDEHRWQPRAGA